MLEIHPLTKEAERQAYIAEHGLPEEAAVLRAYDGSRVTGNLSLTIAGVGEEAVATLRTFEFEDDFTGELLVRAAVSYAFNRAVPKVSAPQSLRNDILDRVGFKTDEQNISIPTQNVVHFCKK